MITTRSKWRWLHDQLWRETDKLLLQTKKRKIEDECRVFNEQWTERYFFADVGVKAVRLICHETVAVFKE